MLTSLTPPPTGHSAHKANEHDEVSFERGVVVMLLEKRMEGWWRVKYNGNEGWCPALCLKQLKGREAEIDAVPLSEVEQARKQAEAALKEAEENEELDKAPPPRTTSKTRTDGPAAPQRDARGRILASNDLVENLFRRAGEVGEG